jgi:hypothetical protein
LVLLLTAKIIFLEISRQSSNIWTVIDSISVWPAALNGTRIARLLVLVVLISVTLSKMSNIFVNGRQ